MITHVTIEHDGVVYALPRPNRHHDVYYFYRSTVPGFPSGNWKCGFLDDKFDHLTRYQAMRHALMCGQVELAACQDETGRYLYSEDVWPREGDDDWSKAPTDATHRSVSGIFYKAIESAAYLWLEMFHDWRPSAFKGAELEMRADLFTPRPVASEIPS